ncbi:MAG: asparagine synthase (glutamine-hydrolyzing) [Candidatus Hodarchaeota archaeon]
MCAINGIIYFDDYPRDILQKKLDIMLEITRHRGPDSSNKVLFKNAALGVNLLSIINPQKSSSIYSEENCKQYLIYNGEIINYRQIMKKFINSDTIEYSDGSVILPLKMKLGTEFIHELFGMFAIAVYSPSENRLQLWRDPLGIKPLYYYHSSKFIIFSSEIKAICAILDYPPEVDFGAIDHILRIRFHPGRSTVFPEIMRVLPGETVIFTPRQSFRQFYWQLDSNEEAKNISYNELVEELRELIKKIISEYCYADVDGGYFVSGGLDSSTVTTVGLQNFSSYKTPISIIFSPQSTEDETYGKKLENRLGVTFEWVTIKDKVALEALQEMISYLDEPLENPIHIGTYLMAKRAKELGIKSVLTGDGADEFFLGYERHEVWFNHDLNNLQDRYLKWLWTLYPEQASNLYTNFAKNLLGPIVDSDGQIVKSFTNFIQALRFEQRERLPEYHCMRLDRMTMAHGVEARVPFLDRRIVEYIQSIPVSIRFGKCGKALLRDIVKPWLPNSIIKRQKTHFPSLPHCWLSGDGANWAKEILLDPGAKTSKWFHSNLIETWLADQQTGRVNYGRILWALIVLELWLNQKWLS